MLTKQALNRWLAAREGVKHIRETEMCLDKEPKEVRRTSGATQVQQAVAFALVLGVVAQYPKQRLKQQSNRHSQNECSIIIVHCALLCDVCLTFGFDYVKT